MDQPARRVAYGSLNSECRCLKLVDTFRLAKLADQAHTLIAERNVDAAQVGSAADGNEAA